MGPAALIVQFTDGDGGYPASVQSPDGKIVTAFYGASQPAHNRYHIGVAIWEPREFAGGKW